MMFFLILYNLDNMNIKVANAKTLVRSWVRKFPLEIGSPEGIGYPLQYSWASLVAQMVKNLPTTQETWV